MPLKIIILYRSVAEFIYINMAKFQEILVYIALGIAIGFLAQKFTGKKKSKKGCDKDDCACH